MALTSVRPESAAPPETTTDPPRSRRFVALLVAVLGMLSATSSLATDLYLPAFPQISADLGASEAQIHLTLTAMMIGLALGQLMIGPLSDMWGRRLPLLVGVGVFTLTSFLCVVAPSAEALTVIRFVQGLAASAGAVISRAVVRDAFDGDAAARFFSRLVLISGIAPLIGPVIGGQLLLLGSWHVIFAALGTAGLVSLVLVFFGMPESLPKSERRPQRLSVTVSSFGRLLRDPAFMLPALTMALSFAMSFTYISTFSFVSQSQFGASAQQFSLVFALNTLGMVLGSQVNAALIGRMHASRRLTTGLVGALTSVVLLALLDVSGNATLVTSSVVLFAMMFFTGLVSPNATSMAISSQPSSLAGTSSALVGALQFGIGSGLASLAGVISGGHATLGGMIVIMLATAVAAALSFLCALLRGRAHAHATA
ncbi:MFS transporter, DHA1 family, bicyclomycin/chloramphenicol resistance protein [Marinactinospora thermotolerans DSM 45154]|uniref:MFS transporter, DHA1 family, bicyclomycin/chloramphenicol resistance protein n=1 Tax=Marinactinospora thermotolerans DSM 45154 TaxID=1122192 RepID=A0A1T4K674_9ACTN|nr:multidrug effflux MFS transporter [Marinactinospora thermotolerans]SJZ37795.1 MFS transporter, DHA1 family, bicyclomycin/chloramphenicol resistance protein [Marinactinospora thermotolerans DSM 45154]